MLRTCVAAFAAGVGGADAVTVLPFDARARAARRVQPPHRPQHLLAAGRGVPRRQGRPTRPAARSPSRSSPTTWPSPGWAELGRDRGGRRASLAALERRLLRARIERSSPSGDRQIAERTRPLTGADRVPEPRTRRCPSGAVRRGRARPVRPYGERLRGAPRRARRRARSSWPRWARSPRTPPAPPSPPTCSPPAASTWSTAGRPTASRTVLAAYDGQPVVCLAGTDKAYAEWGAELVTALREAGAEWVILAGKRDRLDHRDGRRHLRDGRGRARLPAPDEGEARMSVPESFAGLPLTWSRRVERTSPSRSHRRGVDRTLAVARGHRDQAALHGPRPRGSRRARHLPGAGAVPARSLPDDVHDPAVDDPAVRRLLHRRGVQRVLPAQPRRRPEGARASRSTWPRTAATTPTTRG